MAIELATAYVTLTTSARGIGDSVTRELGGVRSAADHAGRESGRAMGDGIADGANTGAGRARSAFTGMAGMAATALAGAGVIEFFSDSVTAASDLNETVSKSGIIFGANAGKIDQWASNAAVKMGLSKQAAMESAASFGDMFSQIGIAGDQATSMSTQVVQLASDLGSFNNLPTAEVVDMMSGAFRGEYDSLQRVIPNISDARVQQEALAMTHKKSAKELTAAEKAQAVMNIVQKDGARASGDFARTSDGLANSQKILAAKLEDSKAKIGEGLMPVMATLAQIAADVLVPALGNTVGWLSKNKDIIGPIAAVVGTLVAAWATYVGVTKIATGVQAVFNAVMALNPVTLIVIGIAALIVALVLAYNKVGWFRDGVNAAFTWIKNAIAGVFGWVKTNWPLLLAILTGPIGLAVLAIVRNWDTIKAAVAAVKDWIVARWNDVVSFFGGLPGKIAGIATKLWGSLKTSASDAYKWVTDKLGGIVSWVTGLPGKISRALRGLFDPMADAARSALNLVARIWNATLGGVSFKIPSWVPGLGGNSYSFPHMPSYAAGGMLEQGWNLVGERGPELAYKAGNSVRVFSNSSSADLTRGAGGQVSVGKLVEISGPVTVRSDQDILDLSREIARETNRRLRAAGVSIGLSGASA